MIEIRLKPLPLVRVTWQWLIHIILVCCASEKEEEINASKAVSVFFPNQGDGERGAHINVSGIALAKNAPNKENGLS